MMQGRTAAAAALVIFVVFSAQAHPHPDWIPEILLEGSLHDSLHESLDYLNDMLGENVAEPEARPQSRQTYFYDRGEFEYRIGLDVDPGSQSYVPYIGTIEDGLVSVRHGFERKTVSRSSLVEYLKEDARDNDGVIHRWENPPVVRFTTGTSDDMAGLAKYAIQAINASLPYDWKISVDPARTSRSPASPLDGEIIIGVEERSDWPSSFIADTEETARGYSLSWWRGAGEMFRSGIVVDPTPNGETDNAEIASTVAHELLHALGRDHPIDFKTRTDTIMSYAHNAHYGVTEELDQDALLAIYGRIEVGTDVDDIYYDLGPWNQWSVHLVGSVNIDYGTVHRFDDETMSFGVRYANGQANPWVTGPEPDTYIEDNPALVGSASWSGGLLGFTPDAESVIGGTHMTVNLSSLDGDLDFTGLTKFPPYHDPSQSGRTFGDGDLHYSIEVYDNGLDSVFGNLTPKPGDDEGIVDGGFFGARHEAMGGTLVRDDLTAAFGGKR